MSVAIMTSGGIDSYVAYYYAKEKGLKPHPIWVNLGQPNAVKEKESIEKFEYDVEKIDISNFYEGTKMTEDNVDDWIIPARNLLLALVGAVRDKKVWICALDSEMHKFAEEHDKTPEFFHHTTGLFTWVLNIIRPETIVETPFRGMNKTDVVRWALKHGISKEQIKKTSTCYNGESKNCGECGACFKRWIALVNNGIKEEFDSKPYKSDYAQESIENMKEAKKNKNYRHYKKERIKNTFSALEKVKT